MFSKRDTLCFVLSYFPPPLHTYYQGAFGKGGQAVGWLWFLLGLWAGGTVGVLAQALVQARRVRQWKQQLEKLSHPRD